MTLTGLKADTLLRVHQSRALLHIHIAPGQSARQDRAGETERWMGALALQLIMFLQERWSREVTEQRARRRIWGAIEMCR